MAPVNRKRAALAAVSALILAGGLSAAAQAEPGKGKGQPSAKAAATFAHWSNERRKAAKPRDLVLDTRGLGYLKAKDGKLTPHGHQVAALASDKETRAKPNNNDSTPPQISESMPKADAEIGGSQAFAATVVDDGSGVKSVSIVISPPSGASQSFPAQKSGDVYSATINGFTDGGGWSWQIVAKDNGRKGGNTATDGPFAFSVVTDGGTVPVDPVDPGDGSGGDPGSTVTNAAWTAPGPVQLAAGRIYFEMPNDRRLRRWSGYVCSGTVIEDGDSGRSVILTAAHCVYDDAYKAFARNVLFIPDQDNTSGGGTDLSCGNDPIGCWAPEFGVVDFDWTAAVFPDNIPWDYAYYVVPDSGAHISGQADSGEALDQAVTPMAIDFNAPAYDVSDNKDFTHALGYSYSEDPNFMYCAEKMTTEGSYNNWWLPSCGLSGGSSGGPWTQSKVEGLGTGPVMSVNSWGYTGLPGMAGPQLDSASGSSASCLFDIATDPDMGVSNNVRDGRAGIAGC
jgi:hypothetical protein